MVDWGKAKAEFDTIILQNGYIVQWLDRITTGSDEAYDTGSSITYGYGDYAVHWTTGSLRAMFTPIRGEDVVIEPGFYEDDYFKMWVDSDSTIAQFDQVIYPSGSGIRYIILQTYEWDLGSETVTQYAIVRRLIPRSGSAY